jgi:Flp pilus assembly pilin Flp
MKTLLLRLWNDQSGAIVSAEIILIASILVIGVIVGLKSLRDSVVTELADVAQAIANVNQSFSFSGTSGHHAFTGGGAFNDMADFCDTADLSDAGNSKCVLICSSGSSPGEGIPGGGGHHGGGHGW